MRSTLYLIGSFLLLVSSLVWAYVSYLDVITCNEEPNWFARSGAIVVLFAVFSAYITKPFVQSKSELDVGNIYAAAKGGNEPPLIPLFAKIKLESKILKIELFFTFVGTYIWAYGDILLVNCVVQSS